MWTKDINRVGTINSNNDNTDNNNSNNNDNNKNNNNNNNDNNDSIDNSNNNEMRKKKETAKRIVGNERNQYERKLGRNIRKNLSNFVNLIVKACKNIIKSNNLMNFKY